MSRAQLNTSPDWVMLGMPCPTGGVAIYASTGGQAALGAAGP